MATTVAQPGTALRKIAKTYASEAGMPVDQYLEKLRKLNPDYSKTSESTVKLGKGVGVQPKEGDAPAGDQPVDTNSPEFQVANILESPLYSQNLKDYYLTQYLPGLTQQTYDINQAQIEFQANEGQRSQQRGEAIKRVAGSYAARGMRSPAAINQDRSAIQAEFANLTRAEQNQIQALLNQRDVLYGAGAKDTESFLTDPNLFGSIGAGARRSSLEGLQQLPERYGLLGLNASTAPMVEKPATAATGATGAITPANTPKTKTPAPGPTAAQRKYAEAEALKARQAEAVRQQAQQRQEAAARAQQAARVARIPGRAR
jgi:hypothetical protein